MALADFAAYKTARDYPQQFIDISKVVTLTSGVGWASSWLATGFPAVGVAPSGAASVPDNTTAGSLGQGNASSGTLRMIVRAIMTAVSTAPSNIGITLMIADRVGHKGGLDGNVNTAQTVSTSALTRFTSGKGVRAAIEVYTAIGATPTTATIDYTNTTPTSGKTSAAVAVGGTGLQNAGRFIPLSLDSADGGAGVTAVNTVTLAAGTGTTGNFGITLYKPLMYIPITASVSQYCQKADPVSDKGFLMPAIPDGACIFFALLGNGQATMGLTGGFRFTET